MSNIEEWEVPEAIREMFDDIESYAACKKECVKNVFGWKRAAYFAKRAAQTQRKAWAAIIEIYPEIDGREDVVFNYTDGVIRAIEQR